MAKKSTTRNFFEESDPDRNRQFRRRWVELPLRKTKSKNLPVKNEQHNTRTAKAA